VNKLAPIESMAVHLKGHHCHTQVPHAETDFSFLFSVRTVCDISHTGAQDLVQSQACRRQERQRHSKWAGTTDLIAKVLRQQRAQGVVMQGQCRVHDAAVPLPQARAAFHISHDNAHAAVEQVHALALPLHQRARGMPVCAAQHLTWQRGIPRACNGLSELGRFELQGPVCLAYNQRARCMPVGEDFLLHTMISQTWPGLRSSQLCALHAACRHASCLKDCFDIQMLIQTHMSALYKRAIKPAVGRYGNLFACMTDSSVLALS